MVRIAGALLGTIVLTGCTAHIVKDARVTEPISVYSTSCDKPYDMVRDCSNSWGPTRKMELNGRTFDLASNDLGNIILFTLTSSGQLVGAPELFGLTDQMGQVLEQIFLDIDVALASQDIAVKKIVPVISPDFLIHSGTVGNVYGYFLELTGDGYFALEAYAIEPSDYAQPNQSLQLDASEAGATE